MLSGWRTLLLPEAATAPRCSKESDQNWRNVAAVARGDALAQRHAALEGRRGHPWPFYVDAWMAAI